MAVGSIIFSLFKAEETARRGSIRSCEGHFPSSRSSPPATQIAVDCRDVSGTDGAMDAAVLLV